MTSKRDLYLMCEEIAEKAHKGQSRNDKITPYIEHPRAVASMHDDPILKCISILHDAVEDGKENDVYLHCITHTLFDNFREKYDKEIASILNALVVLTHQEGDTYMEYIEGIKKNRLAVKVKISDIICNLSDAPSEYQKQKYKKAMKLLLEVV
jgi:(p)ppGpp synthase/HD superfamily hydrolase